MEVPKHEPDTREGIYWEVDENDLYSPDELRYDTDWSWLMPVIQEIENKTGWVLVMAAGYSYFTKDGEDHEIGDGAGYQFISDIHQMVVEFIDWYNGQKQ